VENAAATVRRRLLVRGTVQAVGYRAACARQGQALGLTGVVRNLPDGRVEVVAQGPEAAVGRLIEWCRRGPTWAQVDGVEVTDEPVVPEASGFTVA
jgi:acylphosphatase